MGSVGWLYRCLGSVYSSWVSLVSVGWIGVGGSQAPIGCVRNGIFMSVATAFVHFEPTNVSQPRTGQPELELLLQLLPRVARPTGLV